MLTDTHAHIYNETYNNIEEILSNSINSNVTRIINCADSIETSLEVVALSKIYESVLYCAVGIHPHNVLNYNENDIIKIEEIAKNKNVIAIGEIGLDYYYGLENKEKQIKLFNLQLDLAQKLNLPVLIHSRAATEDTLKILRKYKVKGIIHCFVEEEKIAKEYIQLGFLLGIGGILTFKNSNLSEVIKKVDLEYIVLETDSPYLTPEPFRKYKNEPKYILEVAKCLANIKEIPLEEIAKITNQNLFKIFDF